MFTSWEQFSLAQFGDFTANRLYFIPRQVAMETRGGEEQDEEEEGGRGGDIRHGIRLSDGTLESIKE